MYGWIWHHLPGGVPLRVLQALAIVLVVCALLLFVVFPWLDPKLWFTHVTVQQ